MISRRGFLLVSASLAAAFEPAAPAWADTMLGFQELYASRGVLGNTLSEKVLKLNGMPVAMRGYMAPPLKPEADFFVLTREPVSVCPFCSSDADWPDDIVVVYLKRASTFVQQGHPIEVTGRLEVGSKTDPATGFVSLLRIVDGRYSAL